MQHCSDIREQLEDTDMKTNYGANWQRLACVILLSMVVTAPRAAADPVNGLQVFISNACNACHISAGPVDPLPVTERSAIQGPPLWFAGNKFRADWLVGWLQTPTPIRRVVYGTLVVAPNEHPSLSPPESQDVTDYLMTLTDGAVSIGVVEPAILNRRRMFQGERLFNKKQVCFGCHEYPSRQGNIGGFTGPSLVGAGDRLKEDFVYALFMDPIRFYPNGRMPVYGDKAFEPFTDEDLHLLVQYIGNFTQEEN